MKYILKLIRLPFKAYKKVCKKIYFYILRRKKKKELSLSTSDLFFMQELQHEFTRFDMIVRYLAVEEYYGKNEIGFHLYAKMQNARVFDGYAPESAENFKRLIHSYEENGYDATSRILVDKKLNLQDGSHRMALALYHNLPLVNVEVQCFENPVYYGLDWFIMNQFSTEEISIITQKAAELKQRYNKPFSCVIWSPAAHLKNDMIRDLSYYGKILKSKTYHCTEGEYNNIVRAIYAIDDIKKWKIEKKIEHMQGDSYEFTVLEFLLNYPEFRVKQSTNLPLSKQGERIKKVLRTKYSPFVENYFFDVILHVADNYLQSEYMQAVFEPNISICNMLAELSKYEYALLKRNVPYIPETFPERIPVGKDLDILCSMNDFDAVKKLVLAEALKYTDYSLVQKEKPNHIYIRLEKLGKLILQFDIACALEGVDLTFVVDALAVRVPYDIYYVLSPEYEYLYRAMEYTKNKKKQHHLEYLQQKKKDCDLRLVKKYAFSKNATAVIRNAINPTTIR